MISNLPTTTSIISLVTLSATELDRIITREAGYRTRVAVVTDNRSFPSRDAMLETLAAMRPTQVIDKVFPDPKVADIMDMVESLDGNDISAVVGIGGGSAMDSAKGVAAVLSGGGDLEEYLGPAPSRILIKRDVKLILIPTTAGTGSEVTKFGVYTARTGRKYTLNNPMLQADAAILAGEYVKDLPRSLAASTSFDALSHALETLWNRNATPLSDKAASESAVEILSCIEESFDGEQSHRRRMLEAATMAGVAFNMTGTAMVHALSFILSEEWHVPHGTACAFTLEDAFDLNSADIATRRKLSAIGQQLFGVTDGEQALAMLREMIVRLKQKFGLPSKFSDLGISIGEGQIDPLFARSLDDPKMRNNIVPVDAGMVHEIIKRKI